MLSLLLYSEYWLSRVIGEIYLAQGAKTSPDPASDQAPGIQEAAIGMAMAIGMANLLIYGEKIDRLARIILEQHFLDNLPVTREICDSHQEGGQKLDKTKI